MIGKKATLGTIRKPTVHVCIFRLFALLVSAAENWPAYPAVDRLPVSFAIQAARFGEASPSKLCFYEVSFLGIPGSGSNLLFPDELRCFAAGRGNFGAAPWFAGDPHRSHRVQSRRVSRTYRVFSDAQYHVWPSTTFDKSAGLVAGARMARQPPLPLFASDHSPHGARHFYAAGHSVVDRCRDFCE